MQADSAIALVDAPYNLGPVAVWALGETVTSENGGKYHHHFLLSALKELGGKAALGSSGVPIAGC